MLFVASLLQSAETKEHVTIRYSQSGTIKSVTFSKEAISKEIPKDANAFFTDFLHIKADDSFKIQTIVKQYDKHKSYDQYYRGVLVEGAGYNFHYDDNGIMRYANGNYIEISELSVVPAISEEDAVSLFAKYKGYSLDELIDSHVDLRVKSIKGHLGKDDETPMLVYKVFLNIDRPDNTEYGYIDAQTGEVLCSEPFILEVSSTGTFEMSYLSGYRTANTDYTGTLYRLYDSSRNAIIHTKDLSNNTINSYNTQTSEISDPNNDNIWYKSELNGNRYMALDVHWGLQKIYDRLYNTHNKNSFDDNGGEIDAYVRAMIPDGLYLTRDNACFTYYDNKPLFFFGMGEDTFKPLASLDVVAHEFGHAITHYQIGWLNSQRFLNEGLSDIWAAIMDYRFGDSQTEVWKNGEQILLSNTYNCIRNMADPGSSSALKKMADKYGTTYYNNCDSYGKSGVFSHWFYVLVEGTTGYTPSGDLYSVPPIGMDVAEELIVKAVFESYLRNTTSYEDIREAFVNAARDMDVYGLETAVCNAWYTVGVGDVVYGLSGPNIISSSAVYAIDGLPNAYTVTWSLTDPYYNQNCLQQGTPKNNMCTITRHYYNDMTDATLTAILKNNGVAVKTFTMYHLYAHNDFKGFYTSGNLSGYINYTHIFNVKPNYTTYITSPHFLGATVSYDSSGAIPSIWTFSPTYGDITMVTTNIYAPVVINVDDVYDNHYQLYAFPNNSAACFSISYDDTGIIITLNRNEENLLSCMNFAQQWTIEICNASTGELVTKQTSTNYSETISTSGWPKGVYIVKVIIGKEEYTEKVIMK